MKKTTLLKKAIRGHAPVVAEAIVDEILRVAGFDLSKPINTESKRDHWEFTQEV